MMQVLIDSLVRQAMVMIARLATTRGRRAPLSQVADQVFANLASELQSHGLGRKVIADMFGLTLRAYHYKVQRLSESATDRGRTLWEAVVEYLESKPMASRAQVQQRFSRDDSAGVISVLNDLVSSGIAFSTGEGSATHYRLLEPQELRTASNSTEALATVAWVLIHRYGPLSRSELSRHLPTTKDQALQEALVLLESRGRLKRELLNNEEHYESDQCVIRIDEPEGWEAAVLDHFQAVANTICAKAEVIERTLTFEEPVGGSTFHFDVEADHPLRDEVLGLFARVRREALALRERVDAQRSGLQPKQRITFYVGQHVVRDENTSETEKTDENHA